MKKNLLLSFLLIASFISYSEANEPFPNDNVQLWLAADQGITTKTTQQKVDQKMMSFRGPINPNKKSKSYQHLKTFRLVHL